MKSLLTQESVIRGHIAHGVRRRQTVASVRVVHDLLIYREVALLERVIGTSYLNTALFAFGFDPRSTAVANCVRMSVGTRVKGGVLRCRI